MGRESEKEWVYVLKSLSCTSEANTTLLINYTPIENKNFRKKGFQYSCLIIFHLRKFPSMILKLFLPVCVYFSWFVSQSKQVYLEATLSWFDFLS